MVPVPESRADKRHRAQGRQIALRAAASCKGIMRLAQPSPDLPMTVNETMFPWAKTNSTSNASTHLYRPAPAMLEPAAFQAAKDCERALRQPLNRRKAKQSVSEIRPRIPAD